MHEQRRPGPPRAGPAGLIEEVARADEGQRHHDEVEAGVQRPVRRCEEAVPELQARRQGRARREARRRGPQVAGVRVDEQQVGQIGPMGAVSQDEPGPGIAQNEVPPCRRHLRVKGQPGSADLDGGQYRGDETFAPAQPQAYYIPTPHAAGHHPMSKNRRSPVQIGVGQPVNSDLVWRPVGHLFGPNLARIAFKRGAYLRQFVYAFAELLSDRLSRPLIDRAMTGEPDTFDL